MNVIVSLLCLHRAKRCNVLPNLNICKTNLENVRNLPFLFSRLNSRQWIRELSLFSCIFCTSVEGLDTPPMDSYMGVGKTTQRSLRGPPLSLLTYCCLLLRSLSNPIQPNGKYIKKDSLSLVFLFDLLSPLLSFGLLYVLLNDKKGSVYIYIL